MLHYQYYFNKIKNGRVQQFLKYFIQSYMGGRKLEHGSN
jgi:hypothetical protein